MIIHILVIFLCLSFLVLIHELGHFLLAKRAGVKVLEFGIGYPPLAKKLFTYQGTDFTLNWIPFGGFVRLDGEEALSDIQEQKKLAKDKSLFFNKTIGQRLSIILAGPIVNFIFGIFAFFVVFLFWGIPLNTARIAQVIPGSPAHQAGIKTNVEITEMAFEQETFTINSFSQVINIVDEHPGEKVSITTTGECKYFTCQSEEQKYDTYIRAKDEIPQNEGAIGISFQTSLKFPWYQLPFRSIYYGINQALSMSLLVLQSLGDMIGSLFTKGKIPDEISGPVGIAVIAQEIKIFDQGILFILNLTGMLSINLAVINLLPIPALDGGRAVFIILEKFVNKEKLQKWEMNVNGAGYLFLISLIVLITIKDVVSIFR